MKYLLDTDTLSNLVRRQPPTALIAKLALVPREEQCTSSITLGELVYGATRLLDQGASLWARIEQTLRDYFPILPFDADAARQYGTLRAELERRGTTVDEADLRIASIALTHDLIVVTGNVRHFQRVPNLAVENWLR